jgi:hypothetical protein
MSLRAMGFTHIIVIDKDVSIVVPGAVESAFRHELDAIRECQRLNDMYLGLTKIENGFRVEEV